MAKPNFAKTFLGGVQSLLQHNTERGLRELPGNLIMQGKLLEDLEVTTGSLKVAHGLGRKPRGWFIVDADANETVWRTEWDGKFIGFDASGTITVNVWVF